MRPEAIAKIVQLAQNIVDIAAQDQAQSSPDLAKLHRWLGKPVLSATRKKVLISIVETYGLEAFKFRKEERKVLVYTTGIPKVTFDQAFAYLGKKYLILKFGRLRYRVNPKIFNA